MNAPAPPPAASAYFDKVLQLRQAFWKMGYRPVPVWGPHGSVPSPGKQPVGKGWQIEARKDPPTATVEPSHADAANTGILCDGLRVVDIDIDDRGLAAEVAKLALKLLGAAPVRYRANSGRLLLLYRAAEGEPPKLAVTSKCRVGEDGKALKVEVLGRGQQFVADGLHPSMAEIRWVKDAALRPRDELSVVTEEGIGQFLKEAARIIGADATKTASSVMTTGGLPDPVELTAADPDQLAAVIRKLPNDGLFDDRAEWIRLACAIDSSFPGDARGKRLFLEHAERFSGPITEGEAERVFASVEGTEHVVGAEWLIDRAGAAGVDCSQYRRCVAQAQFVADLGPLPDDERRASLPELLVDKHDFAATAERLRDLLADNGAVFERNGPVKIVQPPDKTVPHLSPLSMEGVIWVAHQLARPVIATAAGFKKDNFPKDSARLYLAMDGDRRLPPLDGISAAPVLCSDGSIRDTQGYDEETRLWCIPGPKLTVKSFPTRRDAELALAVLRKLLATFAFKDAVVKKEGGTALVDQTLPPGLDESSALTALLTACCRPSLRLAPGLLLTAPSYSGGGTGKGLLVRAIAAIAFGHVPHPFNAAPDRIETEKRLVADLLDAAPVLFLDNVNGTALRSDLLASVLTERPARCRVLGFSKMVELNSAAFIAVTGNGLSVSEDLARRFISVELDAGVEDPESREFKPGFIDGVFARRGELLSSALTIWRWGMRASPPAGIPLGSFETWSRWVRDPLVALGCRDPVERIRTAKTRDPARQHVVAIFSAWREAHGDTAILASEVAQVVWDLIDPAGRGRQFLASELSKMSGTRVGGYVLERQGSSAKWTPAKFSVRPA